MIGVTSIALMAAFIGAEASDKPVKGERGELLDRIVAVVDTQTVTQAELVAEARLGLVRRAQDHQQASEVALSNAYLEEFLRYLIDQMLVAREARRVGADEVAEADVLVAYGQLRLRFASEAHFDVFLQQLGVQPSFVRDVLRRELMNDRYLLQRLRTRTLGPKEAAAALPEAAAAQAARRAAQMREFLPGYLKELRQAVEVRQLSAAGGLERQPRPRD